MRQKVKRAENVVAQVCTTSLTGLRSEIADHNQTRDQWESLYDSLQTIFRCSNIVSHQLSCTGYGSRVENILELFDLFFTAAPLDKT